MRTGLWLMSVVLLLATGVAAEEKAMQPSIQEVKRIHEARFLALPGVVSVGIGQDDEGKPVIVVGLDKARAATEAQIPKTLGEHRVLVRITGSIKAMD